MICYRTTGIVTESPTIRRTQVREARLRLAGLAGERCSQLDSAGVCMATSCGGGSWRPADQGIEQECASWHRKGTSAGNQRELLVAVAVGAVGNVGEAPLRSYPGRPGWLPLRPR